MSTAPTTVPKRKRRQLSTKNTPKPIELTPQPIAKKRRRRLQPIITNNSRSPSPSTPISTPDETTIPTLDKSTIPIKTNITSPPKRSIRAAAVAITKRQEKVRLEKEVSPTIEEKKPKRRRKLNCKRVVMVPSSTSSPDELGLEDVPVDTYSKYLNPKVQAKVAPVVIGVKKRKMIQRNNSASNPPPTIKQAVKEDDLDLSQHSILPDSSYIAHISKRGNDSSDESCNVSIGSSASSEFYDAKSEISDISSQPDTLDMPDTVAYKAHEIKEYSKVSDIPTSDMMIRTPDETSEIYDTPPTIFDSPPTIFNTPQILFDMPLDFIEQEPSVKESVTHNEEFKNCEEEKPEKIGFWRSLFKPSEKS